MVHAHVVLDIQTQALDAPYTYQVPSDLEVQVGHGVLVPFGGRKAIGFVVNLQEVETPEREDDAIASALDSGQALLFPLKEKKAKNAGPRKLKNIEAVVGGPYFNELAAKCALWMAARYVAPLSSCVRLFTPPGGVPRCVKGAHGQWIVEQPQIGAVDDRWAMITEAGRSFQPRRGASKQALILQALQHGSMPVAELSREYGSVASSVQALVRAGAVTVESRRRQRYVQDEVVKQLAPITLTSGQAQAVETITGAMDASNGTTIVVDGVTGSGKTEVYLRAIQHALDSDRGAVVLVPEISLTPQTVARFRSRFGNSVAVLHSKMSQGERFDQLDLVRTDQCRVVVGARSALFAPVRNLGIVIIDEEHENTYKQESAPRYVARDVARWMMKQNSGTLVLGSATPSLEALESCNTHADWIHVALPERANGRPLPPVEIIDMAKEFGSGARSMFSRRLSSALEEELGAGHKAVLMLNQRGFAKFVLCRDCGFVPTCPSCSTSLTYHERGNLLICHHCGYTQHYEPVCPKCHSPYLRKFGAGTQRVEDELRALIASFSGVASTARIVRMDADTTTGKGAHARLLTEFAQEGPAVLLGTQMIAKGLDFPDVTIVGVVNADTTLHLPDYRAAERTFSLVQQVAGRAGRAGLAGKVFVQTYDASSIALQAAAGYDRQVWLDDELPKRRMLNYPPYARLANVLVWGPDEQAVMEEARRLHQSIEDAVQAAGQNSWDVLPATPCALAKLRDNYRWHVLIRCPLDQDVSGVIGAVMRQRKPNELVSAVVDIDPSSLV